MVNTVPTLIQFDFMSDVCHIITAICLNVHCVTLSIFNVLTHSYPVG